MIHVDDALWFLMEKDPGLTPYSGEIRMHMDRYNDCRRICTDLLRFIEKRL